MLRDKRISMSKVLLLALPLVLAGCKGKAAAVDPCTTQSTKMKSTNPDKGKERVKKALLNIKKEAREKYKGRVYFKDSKTICRTPEAIAAEEAAALAAQAAAEAKENGEEPPAVAEPTEPVPAADDKKPKKKKKLVLICEGTIKVCVTPEANSGG
jgi:hypothetical protein